MNTSLVSLPVLALVAGSTLLTACAETEAPEADSANADLSSTKALLRGCASLHAMSPRQPDGIVCLERTTSGERISLKTASTVLLDDAPAARSERQVAATAIPEVSNSYRWMDSSRTWNEVTYQSGAETVTVFVPVNGNSHAPTIVRRAGADREAEARFAGFLQIDGEPSCSANLATGVTCQGTVANTFASPRGLAGCADIVEHSFSSRVNGQICAERVLADSARVSLTVDSALKLDGALATRATKLVPGWNDCSRSILSGKTCEIQRGERRVVTYTSGTTTATLWSPTSTEFDFDVNVEVASTKLILRPRFEP